MERIETPPELIHITNRGTKIYASCSYPKENPPEMEEEVFDCLKYLGVFDDIQ
jgi:hypothetical protein